MKNETGKELYPKEFIRAIPKSDLHVHLDGSVRIPTLIELARKRKIKLPSFTEEGLRKLVFKDRYKSLKEYLYGFVFTTAVMQEPEDLERVAYEFAWDNIDEGVRYVEVRFAPQLHVNEKQGLRDVLLAVNRGLNRAKLEQNTQADVLAGKTAPFEYGLITCAMRKFDPQYSRYYAQLFDVHRFASPTTIYSFASLELARAAVAVREEDSLPIVGFDLAGEEAGYPAENHQPAFDYAHRHFLKKTVHAGEAYGPESIFQAITDLKTDRIGHGYYLFSVGSIKARSIEDRHKYVRQLSEYIADRRITIEVCLTSNLQTNPKVKSLDSHAYHKMRKYNLSTTLCTDNRTVSNTTVTDEVYLAANTFGLKQRELKDTIIYGFKRSFFPGSYIEKRRYVRAIIDFYEKIEEAYFGNVEKKI
ncbi:MAG: adenosine deaminase family protein [Deltaproteobacteria bacterium]|nr:adenosine deaminase family protein [Deltaproteobacteria bacterium]